MANPTQAVAVPQKSPVTADSWWDEVDDEGLPVADEVEGYDLIKDEALFSLVGVPFQITKLSFRDGIQQKGIEWCNDFVSAELRVAPDRVLKAEWPRIASRRTGKLITDVYAIPEGGEFLVINNGSTGLYRQIVQYLSAKGLIVLSDEFPETGEKNACRYDMPRSKWEAGSEVRFAPNGDEIWYAEFDLAALGHPLKCRRGLRYSDYKNEFTDDDGAITWYIA